MVPDRKLYHTPNRQTGVKHYLAATSLAGDNNICCIFQKEPDLHSYKLFLAGWTAEKEEGKSRSQERNKEAWKENNSQKEER